MEELVYTLVNEEVTEFKCGNASIEKMIENAYFQTLLQHGYAYKFCRKDRTLGYYMVNFKRILLDKCEDAVDGFYDETMKCFYSVHIRFIAVDSKYQGNKIGGTMLNIIVKNIKKLSENWPIRMITLDALKDKYKWYLKNGFLAFNEKDLDNNDSIIEMYIDCQTTYNKERLEKYVYERGE